MKKTNISVLKSTSRAFELVSKLAGTIQRPISHEFSLQLYPDALQSGSLFNFLSPPSCTLSTSCACKNCKSAFGVHSIQQEQTASVLKICNKKNKKKHSIGPITFVKYCKGFKKCMSIRDKATYHYSCSRAACMGSSPPHIQ